MIEKIQFTKEEIKKIISGKKIAAIDYGAKRIGIATTDIFHISLNPLTTLENSEEIISQIIDLAKKSSIDVIVLGFPIRKGDLESPVQKEILKFKEKLEEEIDLPVILHDESGSSIAASSNMISSGVKKSDRREKGNLDRFAALNILKNFLEEYEGI
jgi:putative Holliday junction resolvase